jgi:hypothetical protein
MGYDQTMLDELVRDVFDSKAADLNNAGQTAQIAFLLAEGVEQSHIDAAAQRRKDTHESI